MRAGPLCPLLAMAHAECLQRHMPSEPGTCLVSLAIFAHADFTQAKIDICRLARGRELNVWGKRCGNVLAD
eukprot:356500-Chlamydomonas_euryale.AAC.9